MKHSLSRMPDGRFLGVQEDGTWWLWDYDPANPDALTSPPHRTGSWETVNSSFVILPMPDGRVLTWRPSDGAWWLWDYEPHGDVLAGSVLSGTWTTVRDGHDLIPLADGTLLDRDRAACTWRVWRYDNGDPDPQRIDHRRAGQPWEILKGPVREGTWHDVEPVATVRIPADRELLALPDGTVIDWSPGGTWRSWTPDALLAPPKGAVIGQRHGIGPRAGGGPIAKGSWGSVGRGHVLIATRDDKVIDWVPANGSFWLWQYDRTAHALVDDPPLQAGVWRSLAEIPPPVPLKAVQTFESGQIVFDDGTPVGGHASVTVRQDGTFTFTGHFHDSGFPSYTVQLLVVVMGDDRVAFTFAHDGSVEGTNVLLGRDRDDDWTDNGANGELAQHWARLQNPAVRWTTSADWDLTSMLKELLKDVGEVAKVVAVVGAL
jgi:hypothetical protein